MQTRFDMISDYTVYIKNDIEYPKFGVKRWVYWLAHGSQSQKYQIRAGNLFLNCIYFRRNRDAWMSHKPLGSCRYNPKHSVDKYCPIFKFSTIFEEVGLTPTSLIRVRFIYLIRTESWVKSHLFHNLEGSATLKPLLQSSVPWLTSKMHDLHFMKNAVYYGSVFPRKRPSLELMGFAQKHLPHACGPHKPYAPGIYASSCDKVCKISKSVIGVIAFFWLENSASHEHNRLSFCAQS